MSGQLVIFRGTKALKVAEKFHAAVANMKAKVALSRPALIARSLNPA